MNCPRFWAAIVAFYAAIGVLYSLYQGATGAAFLFGLALATALSVIADTWPAEDEA